MPTLFRKFTFTVVALSVAMATFIVSPQAAPSAQAEGSFNTYTAVSAGYQHSCGITGTDLVRCWGLAGKPPSDLGPVSQISTGYHVTCAIKKPSSEAQCWENNPSAYYDSVPSNLGPVLEISAGTYHACAVTTDHEAKCWGSSQYGKTNIPSDLGKIDHISTGDYSTCAVTSQGDARCWGYDITDVPVGTGKVKQLSVGKDHACAITLSDSVKCWGHSTYGETNVPVSLVKVSQLDSGDGFTCARRLTEMVVSCWGYNYGSNLTPFLNIQAKSVSVGTEHACAVSSGGQAQCWGNNNFGRTRLPENIRIPVAPEINVNFNDTTSLSLVVEHVYSPSDGSLIWKVIQGETEICQIGLNGSCQVDSVVPAQNYLFKVIGVNEAGETQPILKPVKFCPTQDPAIETSEEYLAKANQKVSFSGKILIANLCSPLPKSIEYRKKVYGKGWTAWKSFKLSSAGNFNFTDAFEFSSKVEIRSKLSGSTYTTKAIAIPVAINYALPLGFYTNSTKIKNGYTQGGEVTVKFGGDKAFNGTCTVLAKTDYAFNFALVSMGSESKFTVFKVKNGTGSGKVAMKWNGQVKVSALCEDPKFVSVFDYRTPTFRANF
jgi:alpha-tubulin suppressor-like RCC1 family protein